MLLYATRFGKIQNIVMICAATKETYTSIQYDTRNDSVPHSCGLIFSSTSLISLISRAVALLYLYTFHITVTTKFLKHNLK